MQFEQDHDISYNADACDVIHNERMNGNDTEISRLLIDCGYYTHLSDFDVQNTMDSDTTNYVDHFSATLITIYPNSTDYFPGDSMAFDYVITDRLGIVVNDVFIAMTIELSHDSYTSLLSIDENGDCQNCEDGVLLSEISISSHFGTNYTMNVQSYSDDFILDTKAITFMVTGCPIGYGADSNNNTCTVCDIFTYNDEDDFVGSCSSCDPNQNDG